MGELNTPPPSFHKDPYFKTMMISGLIKSTTGTFLMTIGGSIIVYSQVQPGNYAGHAPYVGIALVVLGVIVYFIGDLYKVMKKREEDRKREEKDREQFIKTTKVVAELEEQLCRDIINLRSCGTGPCGDQHCEEEIPELYDEITFQTPSSVLVRKAIMVIEGRNEHPTDTRILLELIRMNRMGKINKYQLEKAADL